ncbi:helix-turn-helix domain-containing protein [Actinomadura roseirufa]|uniref:helix-turn-helix domain-containing protein n=1 Tax=Actinomadura roseirufa TaxID=2094049 RepID=UPI0013F16D31|nr:XRE family transcriptional regulator [Actinomadura roseirufa]
MSKQSLGGQIRFRRQAAGMSLDDLAGRVGVSRATLSKIERGERTPTLTAAVAIADTLGIPLPVLLEGDAAARPEVMTDTDPRSFVDQATGVARETLFQPADGVEVVRYLLPAGASAGPFHPHSPGTRELFVVVSGQLQIRAGRHTLDLTTGQVAATPGDVAHRLLNPGTSPTHIVLTIIQPTTD